MTIWEDAQVAESAWWGDCANTYDAETMQLIMARGMGLDVQGSAIATAGNIADIGGGPVSLLLKASGWAEAFVVDPGPYPRWVQMRYETAGIQTWHIPGEEFLTRVGQGELDEIWIYDTLQHVDDPEKIVAGACAIAPIVRLFEWIEFETNDCHIHSLIAAEIEGWANAAGSRVKLGGVETVQWREQDLLSFPAVFVKDAA